MDPMFRVPLILMALMAASAFVSFKLTIFFFVAFVVYGFVYLPIRLTRERRAQSEKNESLFRSMFPELQPCFHPARMVELVRAQFAREKNGEPWQWTNPPGFDAAAQAAVAPDPKGERVRLADSAGTRLAEFVYDKHPEGGVIRIGPGKMTVDIRNPTKPRVRYWHPQREFKWSLDGWVFTTPVADQPFESSSSSSGFSSSSSDSSRSAATAAGIAGLGGTFDGGGASAGWDDDKGSHSSASRGDSAGSASAESSGGTGSTSY
jgi:uncharacterized membrane protein YgcG